MDRLALAVAAARRLAALPVASPAPARVERSRWLAVGDPQASIERFLSVLDAAGALGDDGRLRDDVGLLSIGDHFDYGLDAEAAARDGLAVLHWLAAHPPDQAILIAGNHDVSRVMELAWETDSSFASARAFVGEKAEFHARFPRIATMEMVARDYSGFTERQRASVQQLLASRRFVLAAVAEVMRAPTLFLHAGVTTRELSMLGVEAEAHAIAGALNRFLDERVGRVEKAWSRGELVPLDLSPLHLAGESGVEGGGLLYHRPANLEREGVADPAWEHDAVRPRRYHPRELPKGLVQAVGHTAHKKCVKELRPWVTSRALAIENGGLRTLRAGDEIVYDAGIHPAGAEHAVLYFIDGSMSDPAVSDVPLLAIGRPSF